MRRAASMVTFQPGWVDQVAPGAVPKTQRGPRVRDQVSHRSLREHGKLYTVKEVAEILRVERPQTINDWIRSGKLECFRIGASGREIRISELQLGKFMGLDKVG